MKSKKRTLLQLLHQKHSDRPREELFSHILCGDVFVNGVKEKNPKALVPVDAALMIAEEAEEEKWVSRGGLKLQGILQSWSWEVKGKIVLDAGSSTGGFVQALLRGGAEMVYAVDVGKNQLDYRLRTNPKVRVFEETNARFLPELKPRPQGVTADLSFRGLAGVAGDLLDQASEDWLLALVKPQFEYDHSQDPDFHGVITDKALIPAILEKTRKALLDEGVHLWDVALSSPKGRKGNREYFFLLRKAEFTKPIDWPQCFEELVQGDAN